MESKEMTTLEEIIISLLKYWESWLIIQILTGKLKDKKDV